MQLDEYNDELVQLAIENNIPYPLLRGLFEHESGGNMGAVSEAGAIGFAQLMPSTAEWLGVDPYDPVDNMRGGAKYLRFCLDYFDGDITNAVAGYNAGHGKVAEYLAQTGSPYPYEETLNHSRYVYNRYLANGGSPELWNVPIYNNEIFNALSWGAEMSGNEWGEPVSMVEEYDDADWWDKLSDSFLNAWFSNGSVALARSGLTKDKDSANSTWKPSRQDIENVMKALPESNDAQLFVLLNSSSPEELARFTQMKREDLDREKRVDERDVGLYSIGALAGMALDPLNFIPIGGSLKAVGKGAEISARSLAKKAFYTGMATAGINMLDNKLASRFGGREDNMIAAGLFGFVLGSGSMFVSSLAKRGVNLEKYPSVKRLVARFHSQADALKKKPKTMTDAVQGKANTKGDITDAIQGKTEDVDLTDAVKGEMPKYRGAVNEDVADMYADEKVVELLKSDDISIFTRSKRYGRMKDEPPETMEEALDDLKTFISERGDRKKYKTQNDFLRKFNKEHGTNLTKKKLIKLLEDKDYVKRYSDNGFVYNPVDNSVVLPNGIKIDESDLFISGLGQEIVNASAFIEFHSSDVAREKWWQRLSDKVAKSSWFGDEQAKLGAGKLKASKIFGDMLRSSRGTGTVGELAPIEEIKYQYTREFMPFLAELNDQADKWAVKNGLVLKGLMSRASVEGRYKHDFYRQVIQYIEHPDRFGNLVSDEVKAGADTILRFRKRISKLNAQFNLIEKGTKEDKLFYRRIALEKREHLLTHFKTFDDAVDFLKKYARKAMSPEDIKVVRQRWVKTQEYKDWIARRQKANVETTDIELKFKEHLEEEIDKWAFGTLDAGEHKRFSRSAITKASEQEELPYMRDRMPMDTSVIVKLDGKEWSYDRNLRDLDALSILSTVSNSASGYLAMARHGVYNPRQQLARLFNEAKKEAVSMIQRDASLENELTFELERINRIGSDLLGVALDPSYSTKKHGYSDRIARLLNSFSYAQNGLGMGWNAISEHFNSIGTVNLARVIFGLCPRMNNFIHDLKYGSQLTSKQLKEFIDYKMCLDLMDSITFDPASRKRTQYGALQGWFNRTLSTAEWASDVMSKATSKMNFITKITNIDIQNIQAGVLTDMMKWSRGEYKSTLRKNLFSERNLKNAGIVDVEYFKSKMFKLFDNLNPDDDKALLNRMADLEVTDPNTYSRLVVFLDQASRRSILQNGIGNDNFYWKSTPVKRVLFQFKNFTRMSINGHLLRALETREREDVLGFLASGTAGVGVYSLRAYITAHTLYANDDKKREAYLENALSTGNLVKAFFTRSAMLAATGIVEDVGQALYGGYSSRTTTGGIIPTGRATTPWGLAENVIRRTPAVATAWRVPSTVYNVLNETSQYGEISNETAQAIMNIFPAHRIMPLSVVMAMLGDTYAANASKHPKRKELRQKQRQKEKADKVNKRGDLLSALKGE